MAFRVPGVQILTDHEPSFESLRVTPNNRQSETRTLIVSILSFTIYCIEYVSRLTLKLPINFLSACKVPQRSPGSIYARLVEGGSHRVSFTQAARPSQGSKLLTRVAMTFRTRNVWTKIPARFIFLVSCVSPTHFFPIPYYIVVYVCIWWNVTIIRSYAYFSTFTCMLVGAPKPLWVTQPPETVGFIERVECFNIKSACGFWLAHVECQLVHLSLLIFQLQWRCQTVPP